MFSKNHLLATIGIAAALLATAQRCYAQEPVAVPGMPASYGAWGFDLSGMDKSVRPGDDFYRYANGGWQDRTTLPKDRVSTGSFPDLRNTANDRVHDILTQLDATPATPVTSADKVGALYRAFLDKATVEARGGSPLAQDLLRIRRVSSRADMAALMGEAHLGFGASIFDLDISSDAEHPARYVLHIAQGGLGLPDRDYYLKSEFATKKAAYMRYAATLLQLVDWPDADKQAKAIVEMETLIARVSWPASSLRDPLKTDNRQTRAGLEREMPTFAWQRFLNAAGLGVVSDLVESSNTSMPKIASIFATTPLDTIKAWEAFHTVDAAAPYLSSPFVNAAFAFHSRELAGQRVISPRWRRAVELANESMGSAVGKLYVARYFPAQSQQKMIALVAQLRIALKNRLEHLAWMSPSTKAEALRKLSKVEVQVGYPAQWIDYSSLVIRADDLYGDVARIRAFDWKRRIAQMRQPWNKSDWRFWPQYPTAYNENGQLIFTASMLQAPFFNPLADPAVNYGGIGAVIGHELTHNFDDQGRLFDADERLRDWWTPTDAKRFQDQAKQLGAQYSTIHVLPGVHINGALTMGENIADLGGLTIALDAYLDSLHHRPAPTLDGFTGEQRVFLGWAQIWRTKQSDDSLRRQVVTDLHSPAKARVNGVVRNMDSWYPSFHVSRKDASWVSPKQRINIW